VIPEGESKPVPVEEYDEENYFECPNCDHPQFGEPSECGNCGVEYTWESD